MVDPTGVLHGRDTALDDLRAALGRARDGDGGCLFLYGEAGIGRSRLLAEAGRQAQAAGLVVLRGRAGGISPATPFRPLIEALLAFTRSAAAAADALGPYRLILGRLIPEWRDPGTVAPEQPLIVLAEGVLRLLAAAGAGRGCLLMLDDLHHADAETLAIVEYLADNLAGQPILIVATFLDQECTALDLARSAARRESATLTRLPRLDRDQLREVVAARLGCPPELLDDDVIDPVQRLTAGNPSLAEELVTDLADSGLLRGDDRGWRLIGPLTSYVPGSLTRRLARRLELGDPEQRRLLLTAAVFGERIPVAALRVLTGLGERDLTRELHRAAELIRADSDGAGPEWYAFRHPLTAEALLDSCNSAYRTELAAKAADVLEALDPELPGTLCQIAASLRLRAGDPVRAGRHLAEAARRALADGAAASAVNLLEQAAGLVTGDPALHADVRDALVQALVESGQIDHALRMTAELDGLAGGWSRHRLAALHTRLAWAAVFAARPADGRAQIAAARRLLGPQAGPAETAAIDIVAVHLMELPGPDQFALAESMARQAAAVAEQHDLPVVACQAWQLLGTLVRQHDLDEATFCLERSRRLAVEHGLRNWEIHALVRLGNDDAARDGNLRRLRQVSREARAIGAVTAAYQAESSVALQVALQGGYAEATGIIDRILPTTTRLHLAETAGHLWQTRAVVAGQQGRRRELEQVITELRTQQEDTQSADAKVFGLARAFCSLLEENRPRAVSELESALQADGGNPALSPISGRAGLYPLLCALDGEPDETAYEHGADSVRRLRWNWQFAELARAVWAGRRGEPAVAEAAAASAFQAAEIYPLARHLILRLAAEAALAGGWGDPVAWLRDAEEYFHHRDVAPVAAACRALLRRAGVAVGQRREGSDDIPAALRALGITVREYEILAMLATRMRNGEIADRLHLSPRTVEKHVARLMAKTGRTDRMSLRRFALDQQS